MIFIFLYAQIARGVPALAGTPRRNFSAAWYKKEPEVCCMPTYLDESVDQIFQVLLPTRDDGGLAFFSGQ